MDAIIKPSELSQYPRLGYNVTYIASVIIFDESGENVVLVEERYPEGQWFLPCGRVDPGESIAHAAIRETREEAGIDCKLLSLVSVEEQGVRWIRFNFLGVMTGGTLKSTPDRETLGAAWQPVRMFYDLHKNPKMLTPIPLRGRHFRVPILHAHGIFTNNMHQNVTKQRLLPVQLETLNLKQITINLIIVAKLQKSRKNINFQNKNIEYTQLLTARCSVPSLEMKPPQNRSRGGTIRERCDFMMMSLCSNWRNQYANLAGILALRHGGIDNHDGFEMDLLYTVPNVEKVAEHKWQDIDLENGGIKDRAIVDVLDNERVLPWLSS